MIFFFMQVTIAEKIFNCGTSLVYIIEIYSIFFKNNLTICGNHEEYINMICQNIFEQLTMIVILYDLNQ